MNWIDTRDSLPEFNTTVLFFFPLNNSIESGHIKNIDPIEGRAFLWSDNSDGIMMPLYCYWSKMPETPDI